MSNKHTAASLFTIATLGALAACGGGGSSGPEVDDSLQRGSLIASPPNLVPVPRTDGGFDARLEPATFAAQLEARAPGTTQITGTPKCAISTYYMKYGTVGGANEATDAAGAIMVPSGSDPACSGARPVLLYAHGTTVQKSFNMANLRDNQEASIVAAMYAAQGFIVVAPNFAGYDGSSLNYHPYLNAEQSANDMVDALRAARKAFPVIGAQDGGRLLLAGTSQGGHVAMATQRAMQREYASEFTVTALAGTSGPYALALLSDASFSQTPNLGGTIFFPLLTTSYQRSYGGIYSTPSDIYEAPYATGIDTLLPSSQSTSELFAGGRLPQTATFAPDAVPGPAPGFEPFFASGNLIKTGFRNAYLADAAANPCAPAASGFTCTPQNAFRQAVVRNDLRNYVPNVPVFLCGGSEDPTVFYQSTLATEAYFRANGMPSAALTVVDIDDTPGSSDPFATAKAGFALAKAGVEARATAAGADPATAVSTAYHGTLVTPFCSAAARGFFQSVLAAGT